MRLINERLARQFIRDNSNVTVVASEFWPALEVALQAILRGAIKRNGKHRRITAGELALGNALKVEQAVRESEREE